MDRKEQIRKYKETARPMGVFRVRNCVTGRSLVASSVDLPSMLNRQRFQLEMGGHADKQLQADWNELGPDAFEITILDELEPPEDPAHDSSEDLVMLVEMWREKLTAADEGDFYGG